MNNFNIKNILAVLTYCFMTTATYALSDTAQMDFSITYPETFKITTITSPVLIANITDRTGSLQNQLHSKFQVFSNLAINKKLYLRAISPTTSGMEDAMFDQNGKVYIAFTNIENMPESRALLNCKISSNPKSSPGVVAYPVASVTGGNSKYLRGRGRYELIAKTGVTDVTVNIGTNVLSSSFSTNDPNGFYQTTLELVEADI